MDPWRPWPRADLRVGDADRQAAVAELQRHYVDGRLTSEELSERVTQALAARTFGDLSTLMADLPAAQQQPGQAGLPPGQHRQPDHWNTDWLSPSIVILLIVISVLAVLWMASASGGRVVFPLPLLIWGFFFFGRPFRGGRGRRF
jgi:hypothetical protein